MNLMHAFTKGKKIKLLLLDLTPSKWYIFFEITDSFAKIVKIVHLIFNFGSFNS